MVSAGKRHALRPTDSVRHLLSNRRQRMGRPAAHRGYPLCPSGAIHLAQHALADRNRSI